jgi:hypothetical protein
MLAIPAETGIAESYMSCFFDFFDFLPESGVIELSVVDGAVFASGAEVDGDIDGSAGVAGTGAVLSVVGEAGVGAGIV